MLKKVFRNVFLSLCAFSLSAILFSCAGTAGGGGGGDYEETGLSVRLPGSQGTSKAIGGDGKWELSDVQIFTVTITSDSYKDSKSAAGGQTITFSNIPVGHYKIDSIGKNSNGDITAKGGAEVDIVADQVTQATVTMERCKAWVVTYDVNGGTGTVPIQIVTDGYTATQPADNPSKDGATFVGWSTDRDSNVPFLFSTQITGSITLYAYYTNLPTYQITFDPNGGTLATGTTSPQTVVEGSLPVTPSEPTRAGYTFVGWQTAADGSGSGFPFATPVTANATAYAIWRIQDYSITYELNGGTDNASNPTSYNVESSVITLADPTTREGYTFDGWHEREDFSDTATGAIPTGSTGNKTFYAKWISLYTITYVLKGGTNEVTAPTSYTGLSAVGLPTPTKEDYTFAGWYTDNTYTTKVTEIPVGSSENKTFYAKWAIVTIKVCQNSMYPNMLDGNGANITSGSTDVYYLAFVATVPTGHTVTITSVKKLNSLNEEIGLSGGTLSGENTTEARMVYADLAYDDYYNDGEYTYFKVYCTVDGNSECEMIYVVFSNLRG